MTEFEDAPDADENHPLATLDDARILYGSMVDEISGTVGETGRQYSLLGAGAPILMATLLIALGWMIRGRFEKFLLVATACGFLWTWMWHPDRAERDWDLFANLALPMNLLVGLLLAPVYHRFLHRFHVEEEETASKSKR